MEDFENSTIISVDRIKLTDNYIRDKSGILNALTYASAQYIYKVIEGSSVKWFDVVKGKKLRRTIIHKNSHLDEYFAELLFRAILPKHQKDIEVCEHILMSKEEDSYARISWPNGVVFGIRSDEAGGAKALQFFDEHNNDGTRISPSCSQMVAEEYLGKRIPDSIRKVLNEINFSDSHSGAHQYHIKNLFFAMNDVFFLMGREEAEDIYVHKLLTENWKRAIVDTCITAFVYAFENKLLIGFPNTWADDFKTKIEVTTKKSLGRFLLKTQLKDENPEYFEKTSGRILMHFKVWNKEDEKNKNGEKNRYYHETINGSFWIDKKTKEKVESQCLLLQPLCFALHRCWGDNIADFIMFQIWQSLFQLQIAYDEMKTIVTSINKFKQVNGLNELISVNFGSIRRIDLAQIKFKPEQSSKDNNAKNFDNVTHFQIYEAIVINPHFSNVKQVLTGILNERNSGFGLIFIHNKTINSKAINRGTSMPYSAWKELSNSVTSLEPESWFQLQPDGEYADFILNRTASHQDQLPSNKVTIEYLINQVAI